MMPNESLEATAAALFRFHGLRRCAAPRIRRVLWAYPTPQHRASGDYLFSPSAAAALRHSGDAGPPKFPVFLSARAVSFHPGESDPCI